MIPGKNRRQYVGMIAILLFSAFMLFSLPGCTERNRIDNGLYPGGDEPPEIGRLEHAALRFLFPGSEPRNWKKVKAEIEKRISGTLNASLDFRWIDYSLYFDLAEVLDASNEIYDAFVVSKPEPLYPDFTVLAREGRLKDITDIFPSSAPLLFSMYKSEELAYATVDGRLYAVPSLYPWARCSYLLVDDTIFRRYNLPDITDFDKYELFLKTVLDNEPGMTPGTIENNVRSIQLFTRAAGYVIADEAKRLVYKWDDPEMKLIPWEKTPEFYEIVSRFIDWYKKGYLVPEPDRLKTASFILESILTPPSEETTTLTFTEPESNEIRETGPMRMFHLYPENLVQRDNPMGSFHYNGSFVFPAASANTERALQFIEWVQSDMENYYLMVCGIEGEDYILTDGIPTLPHGVSFMDSTYMYWDGHWAFRNLEYIEPSGQMPGYGTFREFLDKYSKYPPHGAFYPNYGPLQQSADERSAIFDRFDLQFARGQITDTDRLDQFIEMLDQLGSDELAETVYKQMMGK